MALPGLGGRLDERVQHRPRVGGDRHPVAAHLVPERHGIKRCRHRQPGAADDGTADAHHQPRRVIERRHAVDRVARREGRRRRSPERRRDPAPVGDPTHPRLLALAGEEDERQVARASGVGPIPLREPHLSRIDLLHVVGQRHPEVARATTAAEHERVDLPEPGRLRGALGVGDDPLRLTEPGLARRVPVGPQQDGHRAEPAQRHRQRQRARTRAHQDADMLSLANPDRDQAADDVVDPLVDIGRAVGAILEQEERVVRRISGPFGDQRPERDARPRLDLLEPRQPRQLPGRLARQLAQPVGGAPRGA